MCASVGKLQTYNIHMICHRTLINDSFIFMHKQCAEWPIYGLVVDQSSHRISQSFEINRCVCPSFVILTAPYNNHYHNIIKLSICFSLDLGIFSPCSYLTFIWSVCNAQFICIVVDLLLSCGMMTLATLFNRSSAIVDANRNIIIHHSLLYYTWMYRVYCW